MENINNNENLHRQITGMTEPYTSERALAIGMKAPDFMADTTFGAAKMSDYSGKWLVFFSHPRRFHASLYYRIYSICKILSGVFKKKY